MRIEHTQLPRVPNVCSFTPSDVQGKQLLYVTHTRIAHLD